MADGVGALADIVEWVSYLPPKSRAFGHGARFRDARKSWAQAKTFLAGLTTSTVPVKIEISCQQPSQWLSEDVAMGRRGDLGHLFVPPTTETEQNGAHWILDNSRLEDAVDFHLSTPKVGKNEMPPSRLYFFYRFFWRAPWDLGDGGALRGSGLGLHVSDGRIFFQPNFVFHAAIDSFAFREQLVEVERAVPFNFSDAYFKRWIINLARGNTGRFLKPEKGWRSTH